MKDFYKKIVPFFGASCCFLPLKQQEIFTEIEKQKLLITAKANTIEKEKSVQNVELKNFIDELNKTEIYLLVTEPIQEKLDKPILLLLHTEDRMNSEESLINYRHLKFLFSSTNKPYIKNSKVSAYQILRPGWFPSLAKTFRSGKSYYVNNLGGYKSICPVFFNKISAEDFLFQTSKNALTLLKNLPLDSNKEILKGIKNTKIISLGFGDFIEYYSQAERQNYLEKVEFLFIPSLQEDPQDLKSFNKQIENLIKNKSFDFYQKQYQRLSSNKS
jgi:hypothetical protein